MGRIICRTTEEMLALKEIKEWLIENWLHVGDVMFLKAQKKVGKSIFGQVMAFAGSSGEPFLGEYHVVRPLKVAYLMAEGMLSDWKERIKNMKKYHPISEANITWVECDKLKIHTEEGGHELLEALMDYEVDFDLLVWDCLYAFLYNGDYNSNIHMGVFNGNESYIRKHFNAASIVIHHDSEKTYTGKDGKKHSSASVKNAMGSTAILANATQVYTIMKFTDNKKHEYNKVILGDFRSGDLVKELTYVNVVPESNDDEMLGIKVDCLDVDSNRYIVEEYLKENSPTKVRGLLERIERVSCSYETVRRICNRLIKQKRLEKARDESGVMMYTWLG